MDFIIYVAHCKVFHVDYEEIAWIILLRPPRTHEHNSQLILSFLGRNIKLLGTLLQGNKPQSTFNAFQPTIFFYVFPLKASLKCVLIS